MPYPALPSSTLRQRVIDSAMALTLVAVLLGVSIKVLAPFWGVITYALILAVATWHPFNQLADTLGGRRKWAAAVFIVLAGAVVATPLTYLFSTLADIIQLAQYWFTRLHTEGIPPLPHWLTAVPLLGPNIESFWSTVQDDVVGVLKEYAPHLQGVQGWVLNYSTGFLWSVLEVAGGIVVAAILLSSGETSLQMLNAVSARLFGSASHMVMDAATRAVRGVAIGVVGTALIEALLAWAGFALVGISSAPILAGIIFFIVVIQLGPILVWLPVSLWLFSQDQTGPAVFVALYGGVVLMAVDNVLKPILIARSGRLPLLVLLLGVIGGLVAWGVTGMFIGATALAILWTVTQAWTAQTSTTAPQDSGRS